MTERNLFEIFPTDESNTLVVEPTVYLRSLPPEEQAVRVRHFLAELQHEYDDVADKAEQARVSRLMAAARQHLAKLQV